MGSCSLCHTGKSVFLLFFHVIWILLSNKNGLWQNSNSRTLMVIGTDWIGR